MVTDPDVDDADDAADRLRLVADCGRCRALCCIAPGFTRSADFPISKPAGTPCPNLGGDLRCTIHDRLRPDGFRGCVAFDCFGAGQRVSALTAAGPAGGPGDGPGDEVAYRLLPVVRLLHELEWYLLEVLALDAARPQHPAAADALAATRALAAQPVGALLTADLETHRRTVAPVLRAASAAVRCAPDGSAARRPDRPGRSGRPDGPGRSGRSGRSAGRDLAGADLAGADLRGTDLRRADLRGAVLLAADLARADLRGADLLGADTRDADLSGADLRDVLFATRTQLDGARGDASTRLPGWAVRPHHWG